VIPDKVMPRSSEMTCSGELSFNLLTGSSVLEFLGRGHHYAAQPSAAHTTKKPFPVST